MTRDPSGAPTAPTPVGLCLSCRRVRVIRSDRASVFYQCLLSLKDPTFPAYPVIPVRHCRGYEAGSAETGTEQERQRPAK
jgi:hypothetical protein